MEAQLVHQAFHDPLTGLANRALFRDRVAHALQRTGRRREQVSVLFLDLDDFKTVNDSLGHAAGDRLLTTVAERLLNATRGCDTVARLGGDEFAVLLENTRDEEDALTVADRVAQALRAPLALEASELQMCASIGLARARPEDGPEELLRNADVAMYRAKHAGKGRTEVFAPEMHAAIVDRLALEADMRRAINDPASAQFAVHFQPIVRLEDESVVGVEALARWNHPMRGPLPPTTFIPIAESSGLIVPLGAWVLREACRAGQRWTASRRETPDAPPLTLTVNLSGRQLQAPGLVDDVAAALTESGLDPASLVLEITETVIMQQTEANLLTLHALKALGIRLAIDDFGTGYSSLSYLQRFPIDILKIDKSFVDGLSRGGSDAALARTIIALGDTLALRCIAEGVEDDAQRTHLQALGCDYAQGFF
ncbi:MAG: putative bifunctional diguanylate cyclase/phosphodiesterase, partial [Gemmatirosa sp.]